MSPWLGPPHYQCRCGMTTALAFLRLPAILRRQRVRHSEPRETRAKPEAQQTEVGKTDGKQGNGIRRRRQNLLGVPASSSRPPPRPGEAARWSCRGRGLRNSRLTEHWMTCRSSRRTGSAGFAGYKMTHQLKTSRQRTG